MICTGIAVVIFIVIILIFSLTKLHTNTINIQQGGSVSDLQLKVDYIRRMNLYNSVPESTENKVMLKFLQSNLSIQQLESILYELEVNHIIHSKDIIMKKLSCVSHYLIGNMESYNCKDSFALGHKQFISTLTNRPIAANYKFIITDKTSTNSPMFQFDFIRISEDLHNIYVISNQGMYLYSDQDGKSNFRAMEIYNSKIELEEYKKNVSQDPRFLWKVDFIKRENGVNLYTIQSFVEKTFLYYDEIILEQMIEGDVDVFQNKYLFVIQ